MQITAAQVERYVGVPYVPGKFDCADLVQQVLRELFGVEINLPQDRPRFTHRSAMLAQIIRHRPAVAVKRHSPATWQSGDGVLMCVGRLPTHIGLLFDLDGEWWVLHNDAECRASVLTRVRELGAAGFNLDGVYAWLPPQA